MCSATQIALRKRGGRRRRRGFTLIELMIVVAILGVIAALAIPNQQQNVRKAMRAEGLQVLNGIYKAQLLHRTTAGRYADTFDELGFEALGAQRIDERTLRGKFYTFTIQALSQDGVTGANFQAVATADLDPTDAMLDILMIENQLTVVE